MKRRSRGIRVICLLMAAMLIVLNACIATYDVVYAKETSTTQDDEKEDSEETSDEQNSKEDSNDSESDDSRSEDDNLLDVNVYKVRKKCKLFKKADETSKKLATLAVDKQVVMLDKKKVDGQVWYYVFTRVGQEAVKGYVQESQIKQMVCRLVTDNDYLALTQNDSYIWEKITKMGPRICSIAKASEVRVTRIVKIAGEKWYKVNYERSGETISGYMPAEYLAITTDIEYEKYLLKFPKSYRDALRELHEKYPEWEMVPVYTKLSWKRVIKNETKIGRNNISSTVPAGGEASSSSAPLSYLSTANGCYDWVKDKYTLRDGTTWYTAAKEVVEYYMDPRNFLTAKEIFRFETMEYDEDTQNIKGVKAILKGTFMAKKYTVTVTKTVKKKVKVNGKTVIKKVKKKVKVKRSYAETFMKAAKKSGVSPYVLAARAKQELSPKGSGSSSGKTKGYEGYYNFYNIGGNDSAGGGAVQNALSYAKNKKEKTYLRPWDTQTKSIIGGAMFIADQYINCGQNTYYFQKFNVVNKDDLFKHQYMTNIQAPDSESRSHYEMYREMGQLKDKKTFYIPIYEDMPEEACELPDKKGNANNYLKVLTVKNGVNKKTLQSCLNKKFKYNRKTYKLVVPESVSKIRISAVAANKDCKVKGANKTYKLAVGKTKIIKIRCKAGNGDVRIYKIYATRKSA